MGIETGGKHIPLFQIPLLFQPEGRVKLLQIIENQIDETGEILGITIHNLGPVDVLVIEIAEGFYCFKDIIRETDAILFIGTLYQIIYKRCDNLTVGGPQSCLDNLRQIPAIYNAES